MRPIDAALHYAAQGWHVFPCHTATGSGCSCGNPACSSPGKHPRVARGLLTATTDVRQIQRWWLRWADANVAIRTGHISDLVVVDVDPDHGGTRTIRHLVRAHGELRQAPRVRTGSGGWHLYFTHPGATVRNSAGRIGPGIDIRGDGGYVIAPPSRHLHGTVYRWERNGAAPIVTPDWLLERLRPEISAAEPRIERSGGSTSGWADAAFAGELRRLSQAREGQRNHTLNRCAFALGQLVGAGHLDHGEVEHALITAATAIGLSAAEARRTTTSGLRAGCAHPRRLRLLSADRSAGVGPVSPT